MTPMSIWSVGMVHSSVQADSVACQAVKTAEIGLFFNSGQVCCAGSRVFVHEKIYDEFVGKECRM